MSTHGKTLALKLLLEGIEVDCVSASFGCGESSPAYATMSVPPSDFIYDLPPRIHVSLYYAEILPEAEGLSASRQPDLTDPENWILAFAGEYVQLGYIKQGGERNGTLVCVDFTSYWSSAQLYWGSGNTALAGVRNVIASGATQFTTSTGKVTSTNTLTRIMLGRPTSIPTLPGMLGGVVALLEAVTGVYASPSGNKFRGVNDFMSQAELRLHLTRMIGASPEDDTTLAFADHGDLKMYFQQVAASVQSTASYMDLVQTLLGKVFYRWASVIAPPFIKKGAIVGFKIAVPRKINFAAHKNLGDTYNKILLTKKAVFNRLRSTSARLAENGVSSAALEDRDPTRTTNITGLIQGGVPAEHARFTEDLVKIGLVDKSMSRQKATYEELSTNSTQQQALRKLGADITNTKGVPRNTAAQISAGLEKAVAAVGYLNEVNAVEGTQGGAPDPRDDGAKDSPYVGHNQYNLRRADAELDEALKRVARAVTKVDTYAVKGTLDSRMHAVLFMPDLFMAPPPKCNVLFPDQYTSIQFSRSYLQEVTRVLLYGRSMYGHAYKTGYFAPNTSILAGPPAADAQDAVTKGVSFLMYHERFTGPILALESLGDNGVFRKLSKRAKGIDEKAERARRKKGLIEPDDELERVEGQAAYSPQAHMQRAANYLFFSKRYSSRNASVNARFSPQLVPGLPMLILDPIEGGTSRITVDGQAAGTETSGGTHFIGTPISITHNISTEGASTQIALRNCRDHREGGDIFGAGVGPIDSKKRIVALRRRLQSRVTVMDVTDKRADGTVRTEGLDYIATDVEYKAQKQRGVTDVTNTPMERPTADGQTLAARRIRVSSKGKTREVVIERMAKSELYKLKPSANTEYTVNPDIPDSAAAFRVTETTVTAVATYRDVKFTFEATATPPWFSTIFLPHNIGQRYYQQMLGCTSVLDDPVLDVPPDTEYGADAEEEVVCKMGNGDEAKLLRIPKALTEEALTTGVAAERLAETWLGLRGAGANMDAFVRNYNRRSYTTMLDLMGGPGYNPAILLKSAMEYPEERFNEEGFHSNAFGPYTGLEKPDGSPLLADALIDSVSKSVGKPRVTRDNITPLADTRAEKYAAVEAYAADIARRSTSPKA